MKGLACLFVLAGLLQYCAAIQHVRLVYRPGPYGSTLQTADTRFTLSDRDATKLKAGESNWPQDDRVLSRTVYDGNPTHFDASWKKYSEPKPEELESTVQERLDALKAKYPSMRDVETTYSDAAGNRPMPA